MARLPVLFLFLLALAACGESGLSRFDGEPVPPPPPKAGPGEKIRIVGSSTAAPFSVTVAEHFGASTPFGTPIVERNGTGAGFDVFCRGLGADTPSIVNASRPAEPEELESCAKSGVEEIVEVLFGYDGIVFGTARGGPDLDLTKTQIYLAVAREVPDGAGGWRTNPYRRWSDIDPALPDMPIRVFGPPPTSGTRDAFIDLALIPGALALPELARMAEADREDFLMHVRQIRIDGAWIDAGENDAAIIQTLIKDAQAVGVLGFSFLDQNLDRVKAAKIGGVSPSFETIASGEYRVSRSLFFYVKRQNVTLVPGLLAFVEAFTDEAAFGPTGYLTEKGLIPLPDELRAETRASARAMTPMPMP